MTPLLLADVGNFFENAIIVVVTAAVCLLVGYLAGRAGWFAKTTDELKSK